MSATAVLAPPGGLPAAPLYAWAVGFNPAVKAPVFGAVYRRLGQRLGHAPDASDLVAAARPARHPLHPCFEWDDQAAAEAWRLDQANNLIRNLRVTFTGGGFEDQPVRAFFRVEVDGERTWAPHDIVLREPVLQEQVLQDILRDLQAFVRKYAVFLTAIGAEKQAAAFEAAVRRALPA